MSNTTAGTAYQKLSHSSRKTVTTSSKAVVAPLHIPSKSTKLSHTISKTVTLLQSLYHHPTLHPSIPSSTSDILTAPLRLQGGWDWECVPDLPRNAQHCDSFTLHCNVAFSTLLANQKPHVVNIIWKFTDSRLFSTDSHINCRINQQMTKLNLGRARNKELSIWSHWRCTRTQHTWTRHVHHIGSTCFGVMTSIFSEN